MSTDCFAHRPPRKWRQVEVAVAPAMTEATAALVAHLSGCGVQVEVVTEADPPLDAVTGYLDATELHLVERLRAAVNELHRHFVGLPRPELHVQWLEEEDWGSNWKRYFTTFHITPRLVIKPSWEARQVMEGELVIELDPGLAFGTGHHASTAMALRLLDELTGAGTPPATVLDIGTGTGILAMAAARFGAGDILAVDNDPDAVATARQNILNNRLEKAVAVGDDDIATLRGPFDLVLANITHDVLRGLAPAIAGLLAPGGWLILSGILAGLQEESIVRGYGVLGLTLLKTERSEPWVGLLLRKNDE